MKEKRNWVGVTGLMKGCSAAILILYPYCFNSLSGQETSGKEDENLVELSVFTVDASRDVGYRATNSISGTSLNTPIKDLPMSIEVVTSEFISDVGATDFEESLSYTSGVFTDQFAERAADSEDGNNSPGANTGTFRDRSASSRAGVGGQFGNAVIIRGFNTPFQNRDGFRWGGLIAQYGVTLGGTVDTVNVERMEVVRGPNSLLYGVGVLSGIVNVIPKKPLPEQRQKMEFNVGSNGFFRIDGEASGPITRNLFGGQLLYRAAFSHEERGDWTDFRDKEKDYVVGQLEYRGRLQKMKLFFEVQHFDGTVHGIGDRHVFDNLKAAVNPAFRNEFGEQIKWTKDLGGLPESFRLTGPDTFQDRVETDILATMEYTPFKNFSLFLGTFYTKAEENEFNVNISTITNQERSFNIPVIRGRVSDPRTDPERRAEARNFLDKFVETFLYEPILEDPEDTRDPNDHKVIRYWWKNTPTVTDTEQYLFRATYNFDTPFIGGKATHRILVGRHDIQDKADFATGRERIDRQFATRGEFDSDIPLQYKRIDDFSPIRYKGEVLAQPGREYRRVKLWFSGQYALYQGSFLKDRLKLIAGIRRDRYHSLDIEYDRGNVKGDPESIGLVNNPENRNFGFIDGSAEWGPNGTDPEKSTTTNVFLGYKISEALSFYTLVAEGITPNTGIRDGNYDGISSERTRSKEFGFKFDLLKGKLSGSLAFYRIERDNAVVEWDDAPAPSKWEGGNNPDQTGDELSGFRPTVVASGEVPINYGVDSSYFDFEIGKVITRDPETGKRRLEFPDGLIAREGEFQGSNNPQDFFYLDYNKLDQPAIDKNGNPTGKNWRYYLEKAFADASNGKGRQDFRQQNGPDDIDPIIYRRTNGTPHGTTVSEARGANVTFEEEATGFDMQFIYSPKPNWQILFSFAHTQREATSPFRLVSVIDPVSGVGFGTEYDIWVRDFGRAAFGLEEQDGDGDGVVDRVTKDGQPVGQGDTDTADLVSGLQGTSLFLGSEDSASFWTKYTFEEGPLRRFQIGGGFRYLGPAATSFAIGGNQLAKNKFRTPPTDAFWRFDAMVQYRWRWHNLNWRVKLNVFNLLDDQKGLRVAQFDDPGGTVFRRTETFHAPRNFRLSFSMQF